MRLIAAILGTAVLCAAFAAGAQEEAPETTVFDKPCFEQAAESAHIAGYSLSKVQRWLHEVALKRIDPETGLYIADGKWNYRDTAADCYPFLVWAAWAVDQSALSGPVREVLHAERELCNYLDRIPAPFDLEKRAVVEDFPYEDLVFQASEYVKDGLIAIVEVTGRSEWFTRMLAIEEDLWKHARVETPFGKIPSTNIEVNGEQLQALTRLYTMTGQSKFLDWAERLADYYLSQDDFVPERLRDHGCEIIGGLGLLLAVESAHRPEKAEEYRPAIERMLNEILEKGTNAHGMMYNKLGDPDSGLSDGWGYNYVTYLCYDMIAGEPVYRPAVKATLRNLSEPIYTDYKWEGDSIDGYADSIEGGIYLLNRVPVEEGFAWVDREMANNVVHSDQPLQKAELWGTMKLQSNGVRTTIMHALMHTRGVLARPWKQGLRIGAHPCGDGLAIVVKTHEPWAGHLAFDVPRHRTMMGFTKDWPRMNTLPEWFTVEPNQRYVVEFEGAEESRFERGMGLRSGLEVRLPEGGMARIFVRPALR